MAAQISVLGSSLVEVSRVQWASLLAATVSLSPLPVLRRQPHRSHLQSTGLLTCTTIRLSSTSHAALRIIYSFIPWQSSQGPGLLPYPMCGMHTTGRCTIPRNISSATSLHLTYCKYRLTGRWPWKVEDALKSYGEPIIQTILCRQADIFKAMSSALLQMSSFSSRLRRPEVSTQPKHVGQHKLA